MKYYIFHIERNGQRKQVGYPGDILSFGHAEKIKHWLEQKNPGEIYEIVKDEE